MIPGQRLYRVLVTRTALVVAGDPEEAVSLAENLAEGEGSVRVLPLTRKNTRPEELLVVPYGGLGLTVEGWLARIEEEEARLRYEAELASRQLRLPGT